jgi:hypothetical protein
MAKKDYNFRENVTDIKEEWGDYANTARDKCGWPDNKGEPAFNAGHVQLKCFINNTCPFYKTPYKEDSIIFNSATFDELIGTLPEAITGSLTSTPGLEGIYFTPRKVFRHNYMNIYSPDTDSTLYNSHASSNYKLENFEVYYKSVTKDRVTGADKTLYRAEHDWIILPSLFDSNSCADATVPECNTKAQWIYYDKKVTINRYEDSDLKLDYPEYYYNEYIDSVEEDEDGNFIPKPGVDPKILPFNIQMPVQANIYDKNALGIHWRVRKRTPIFKGADFFIRFYKEAQEPVRYIFQGNKDKVVKFKRIKYRPLDYTWDGPDSMVLVNSLDKNKKYANEAVRPAKGAKNSNLYDFYTQAYYIIEMVGIEKKGSQVRYFIVIPHRGYPIFVNFFRTEDGKGVISQKLGQPFRGVSGASLINAPFFDIVVRNHLGRLAIQFEGDGFGEIPPWIVERVDRVPKKLTAKQEAAGETSYMVEEIRNLVIPKGHISIWGGNIRCGFIFGYLQYSESLMSFIYPPKHTDDSSDSEDKEDNDKAFTKIDPKEVYHSSDYFESDPLWLPMNRDGEGEEDVKAVHAISFEAHSESQLEKGSIGDSQIEFDKAPLFTQDAQFYRNYNEEVTNKAKKDKKWKQGYFYYNSPVKEFSLPTNKGFAPKTSNIIIQKYKYLNYERTRHQGFDTYVGMMCGDHYFSKTDNSNYWSSFDVNPILANPSFYSPSTSLPSNDGGWYLRDCKTPILAHVRLISFFSDLPRWEDGTSIASGTRRDPEEEKQIDDPDDPGNKIAAPLSKNFIDASDHVMNFSHSWTSTSMTSLEHSGTIQFFLNPNMTVENLPGRDYIHNVTDKLFLLQDKTFYIEIWAGYKDLEGLSADGNCVNNVTGNVVSNYSRIPGLYKMFTGMCSGGSISYEHNKIIMTCKIDDYTKILKNMLFFNSPWFDAMKDSVAVREILNMAGFRDQGKYDPGKLIAELAKSAIADTDQELHTHLDGRAFKYNNFGLPSGYNRLEQPAFKFNDADPFMDAISKISAITAKIFYFDEFGIAHFEEHQDLVEEDFEQKVPLVSLYFFTTNPGINPGHIVFNKVEKSFDVESVYTHLKSTTNTPDMHMLIRDRLKWESIENPDAPGFLGYQKTFYQAESMFGSKEAQIEAMNKYAVMFKPIIGIKFETYGLPLRATDIISIDNEIVRVTKVDHNFDAAKNEWWMSVDCQRFQPISASDTGKFKEEE